MLVVLAAGWAPRIIRASLLLAHLAHPVRDGRNLVKQMSNYFSTKKNVLLVCSTGCKLIRLFVLCLLLGHFRVTAFHHAGAPEGEHLHVCMHRMRQCRDCRIGHSCYTYYMPECVPSRKHRVRGGGWPAGYDHMSAPHTPDVLYHC